MECDDEMAPSAARTESMKHAQLLLASGSPRRQALLGLLGVRFEVVANDVDEVRGADEGPREYVRRLAVEKAQAAHRHHSGIVLGADTIAVLDGVIMEKPIDRRDAYRMWHAMSNRCHEILTAVAVVNDQRTESVVTSTSVWFRAISEAEMAYYWDTGEPQDKAGAYAIQGIGGAFVERIQGSYHGVVGLPLVETSELLSSFGVKVLSSHE